MGMITQYLTLGTLALAAAKYGNKNPLLAEVVKCSVMASSLSVILWFGFGQSSVKNNSQKIIFYLDEITGDRMVCAPGQIAYNIDGIRVGDKVYKVSDGVSVEVTPQGEVRFTSFFSKCFSKLLVDDFLLTTPDEYFKPLFEV